MYVICMLQAQIAMPLMSHSLSFAVCICFASTETLDTVGFLDTVPVSSSDCYAIRLLSYQ